MVPVLNLHREQIETIQQHDHFEEPHRHKAQSHHQNDLAHHHSSEQYLEQNHLWHPRPEHESKPDLPLAQRANRLAPTFALDKAQHHYLTYSEEPQSLLKQRANWNPYCL